ncbi:MAG: TraI domain-containing protein [Rubrivivax sp.]|nr:TraI domain-containing protein [Rubrivivax sp.]
MSFEALTKVVIFVSAFCIGATFVYRRSRRGAGAVSPATTPRRTHRATLRDRPKALVAPLQLLGRLLRPLDSSGGQAAALLPGLAIPPRPASHVPVRSFEAIVEDTSTQRLLESIERKTRLTHNNFERDCIPVLRAFAEFVQFLPASECHHHAQPGGLWIHALEVVDAALTFRAGVELPSGASTEERKRQEHRWTYAVFAAALLHDAGKPVTDVRVTLFGPDPLAGLGTSQLWAPMAGPMRAFAAHFYSVAFIDASDRDYVAHTNLAAMLLHKFLPERVMRWLGEDAPLLSQLVDYLSGDDPDGTLGSVIKRSDSDSVRRNLLHGPRTRFASARTVPLIERLMRALRRMLAEGALPLNRPGAAGWVHDGKVWFVCARLADEVRSYLEQHESALGVPGKDRNDRLFDTWQEFGAALSAPDGGAVWRAHVQCEGWSPPEPFTLLSFRLQALFPDESQFPRSMNGSVTPVRLNPRGVAAGEPAVREGAPSLVDHAAAEPAAAAPTEALCARPIHAPNLAPEPRTTSATAPMAAADEDYTMPTLPHPLGRDIPGPAADLSSVRARDAEDADTLPAADQAAGEFNRGAHTETPQLAQPVQARQRGLRPGEGGATPPLAPAQRPVPAAAGSAAPVQFGTRTGGKGPTPAAAAFMAWVARAVATGELTYNEDGALVHFVADGALLLSPEIFRRFFAAHVPVSDGPIAALRQSHGDRAFARLQNELAKSGWTARNGDENLHYYAFLKADGSPSRTASFYLIRQPALFWSPVPVPNARIRIAARPKRMKLPRSADSGSDRPNHSQVGVPDAGTLP